MAIFAPGIRGRDGRVKTSSSRNVVASLSLTAMVDMFTVLTVFLLQNYKTTGEVLNLAKNLQLPQASVTKELKPAHVVTISKDELKLDEMVLGTFLQVKERADWMIPLLHQQYQSALQKDEADAKSGLKSRLQKAVTSAKKADGSPAEDDTFRKVTVQADKEIDILSIKKVLFTLTEAGASEINFAVIQKEKLVEGQPATVK